MLAAAMCAGLLASPVSSSAAVSLPAMCRSSLAAVERFDMDVSKLTTRGVLFLDDREVIVDGPGATWALFDEVDNTWNNRFHGMQWLIPAQLAGVDAVDLLLKRDLALPDAGGLVDNATLRATGWTAGALRIRQGAVNCLFEITGDERLRPAMDELVAANLDSERYRGRPLDQPHNLGVLANLVLLDSAETFDVPLWRDLAIARMKADADFVFSACGMSVEQSTAYHLLNLKTWRRAMRSLDDTDAQAMGGAIIAGERAISALTRPDGVLESIGDGNQSDQSQRLAAQELSDFSLWCKARGWAANRSVGAEESVDDSDIHYTLRFGPRRKGHGHNDHGSLTWYALGVPVLSDPGLFDKKRDQRFARARGTESHSVFVPEGRSMRAPTIASRTPSIDGVDSFRLRTRYKDIVRTRQVSVSLTEPVLRVEDSGVSRFAMRWLQRWQLDPAWQRVDATSWQDPIAMHPDGVWLYVACHATRTVRPAVWSVEMFPQRRKAHTAMSLACGTRGKDVTMKTVVMASRQQGTLVWDHVTDAYTIVTPAV